MCFFHGDPSFFNLFFQDHPAQLLVPYKVHDLGGSGIWAIVTLGHVHIFHKALAWNIDSVNGGYICLSFWGAHPGTTGQYVTQNKGEKRHCDNKDKEDTSLSNAV